MFQFYRYKGGPAIQFLATLLGAFNLISGGMHYGWSSPSLPILQSNDSTVPITNEEGSILVVLVLIGTVTGCITTGFIINKIGRKTTVLLASVPGVISWMVIAFAQSAVVLMVGRYVGGISDGITFCSLNIYISEIASPKYRGFLGSLIGVTYALGHLLINIIGSLYSIRDTAIICAIMPGILLLTFHWMPESPYYLLMKHKVDEAKRSLAVLNGTENCEDDLDRIAQGIKEQNLQESSFWDLIRVPKNRKILFTVMIVRGVQQLSGDTPMLFYTETIFLSMGSTLSPKTCVLVFLSIEVTMCAFSSLIVDKVGRKPLLMISMGGCGTTLLIAAAHFYFRYRGNVDVSEFDYVPMVALFGYIFMFGIALQSIPISIAGELFPTNVKAYGVSFNDVYFSAIAAGTTKYFQFTKDAYGLDVPFLTFAIFCFLGVIYVAFFLVETKEKTLEAIQSEIG